MKSIYLTTTLPYVNAEPHIGFALELVQVDVVARFNRLMGKEVFLNTGTDEHGVKIYLKALEKKESVQDYVDRYFNSFKILPAKLGVIDDLNFIRTTDQNHILAAQEFWRRCQANGDIYKKKYQAKYCIGCEMEKHDSEIDNGHCFIHPNLELELIAEENYFFRFSNYTEKLLALYQDQPNFVLPTHRQTEISKFVITGLRDFSISRLATKMPWGIPVPDDPDHVMYVWFDALINYISAIGWPNDEGKFKKWWPVIQFAGKDNLRQQAAMWPAMLMSAGLVVPQQILIHGFINSGGQKMSKSLGNVISPFTIIDEYGTDALRYYLLRHVNPFEDSDFTKDKFKEAYNANLANGLGNLVSRIMTLAERHLPEAPIIPADTMPADFKKAVEAYQFSQACDLVWQQIGDLDERIATTEPFKVIKTDPSKGQELISNLVIDLYTIGRMLNPLLPDTSSAIKDLIKKNSKPVSPLFLRRE